MKKPVVDYREFRFSKLRDPQFSHLLCLLGWIPYFALYFITENFIPLERCYPIHSVLDDLIPFCEYFVLAYAGWYVLIVVSLLYFALYNTDNFRKLSKYIFITQMVAMAIYIIFPNRQDLRPEYFVRENIFTDIMGVIYSFDTSTNVCPSLHVAYSLGIASTWLREHSVTKWVKTFIVIFCFFVCISVAFVKQHSVVDIFAAIPVCLLAEWMTFWRRKKV